MLWQIVKLYWMLWICSSYSNILTHPSTYPWVIITEWFPIPYLTDWVDLDNYSKYNESSFKIKEEWFFCAQCNDFLPQYRMRKLDWCMCSLECGLHYRGMSYNDFL